MALLNRPMTEDEARKMIADWRKSLYGAPVATFYDMMEDARKNPTPSYVHYEPVREKPVYVDSKRFYCRTIFRSPSDCDWIVPGTLRDTSDL